MRRYYRYATQYTALTWFCWLTLFAQFWLGESPSQSLTKNYRNSISHLFQFQCPLCTESLSSSLSLERHVNRDHADVLSPMSNKMTRTSTSANAKKRTRLDVNENNGNSSIPEASEQVKVVNKNTEILLCKLQSANHFYNWLMRCKVDRCTHLSHVICWRDLKIFPSYFWRNAPSATRRDSETLMS